MSIRGRLLALDNRVMGPPRPESVRDLRTLFVVSLASTIAFLLAVAVTGSSRFLGTGGTLLFMTLVSGIRWRRRRHQVDKGEPPRSSGTSRAQD